MSSEEIWLATEVVKERLWKIASRLTMDFESAVGHVDPDTIQFVRILESKAPWLAKIWQVPRQFSLLQLGSSTSFEYVLAVNDARVAGLMVPKVKEVLAVLSQLMRIGHDGKICKPDREDFRFLLDTFGIDWSVGGGNEDEIQKLDARFSFLDQVPTK